jgi:hypothetical protein
LSDSNSIEAVVTIGVVYRIVLFYADERFILQDCGVIKPLYLFYLGVYDT